MNKIYHFRNISGQMFFITELGKRIYADSDKIITMTEEDISRSDFLSSLITDKRLVEITQEEAYDFPQQEPFTEFQIEGDTTKRPESDLHGNKELEPNPHGNTERPRSVLVDEKPERNILVDESKNYKSIYDNSLENPVKKK